MNPLIRHVMVGVLALGLGAVAWSGDLAPRPSASPVATGRGESAIPREMQLTALPERGLSVDQDTMTRERAELGRLLFFDPILSSTRDVACSTCHVPEFGWGDGRPGPIGVGGRGVGPMRVWVGVEGGSTMGARALPILTRNVPTLLNVAFNGWLAGVEVEPLRAPMFWDSREQGLEAQALIPLRTLGEMLGPGCDEASAVPRAVGRVGAVAEYRSRFQSAFLGRGSTEERTRSEVRGNAGSVSAREPARTASGEARESGGASPVTAERLAMALAAFERTLVTGGARVDRYLRGDTQALEAREVAGLRVFERAGCQHCHGGPMFSDYKLHFIGAPDTSPSGDGSRALRTPTLRNLRRTAPYMHNGSLRTLREVLAFYEALSDQVSETLDGGDLQSQPPLDPLLRNLNLVADDFEALEAFLGTLESPMYDLSRPTRVPSGLAVPRPIQPTPPL